GRLRPVSYKNRTGDLRQVLTVFASDVRFLQRPSKLSSRPQGPLLSQSIPEAHIYESYDEDESDDQVKDSIYTDTLQADFDREREEEMLDIMSEYDESQFRQKIEDGDYSPSDGENLRDPDDFDLEAGHQIDSEDDL